MTVAQDSTAVSSSSARVPTIAIIGLEGSGKTVLTVTLAKRLSTIDARGVFLNPQGVKTLKYVENVWQTLQSGEWPPSTPPGELFELRWKLQLVGESECDVRLIDAAGQDLRLLFGDEQIDAVDSLPAHLQALADYCRSADIVLFLVNLKDYVGQGNPEQRTANEAAIKSAMDYLDGSARRKRVCLILTQTDLYEELARERGGWLELVAHAIPYIFSAHVQVQHVAVHPVSSVADTRVVVDETGTPRRVPVAGFRSEGLDEVIDWLKTQVREVKAELEEEAAHASEPPGSTKGTTPPPDETWQVVVGWIIAVVIGIFLLRGCIPGCGAREDAPEPHEVPRPPPRPAVTFDWDINWGRFYDDIWLKNTSNVTLTNVELTIYIVKDGQNWQPLKLYAPGIYSGQTHTWTNAISVPGSKVDSAKAHIKCDQSP